jgi:hypothetical protein
MTPRTARTLLACGLAIALAAEPARAAPEYDPPRVESSADVSQRRFSDPFTSRPLALELSSSLGGPFGLVGGALDWSVSSGFALTAGGGMTRDGGPRVGLMSRLRLRLYDELRTGLEGGLSGSSYTRRQSCRSAVCPEWHWDTAVWGHIGLFAELRSFDGWGARASFGATSVFNLVDAACERCEPGSVPPLHVTTVPYAGLALCRVF